MSVLRGYRAFSKLSGPAYRFFRGGKVMVQQHAGGDQTCSVVVEPVDFDLRRKVFGWIPLLYIESQQITNRLAMNFTSSPPSIMRAK